MDEIDELIYRTRTAQGLPLTIDDPATIERVAAIVRSAKSDLSDLDRTDCSTAETDQSSPAQ